MDLARRLSPSDRCDRDALTLSRSLRLQRQKKGLAGPGCVSGFSRTCRSLLERTSADPRERDADANRL